MQPTADVRNVVVFREGRPPRPLHMRVFQSFKSLWHLLEVTIIVSVCEAAVRQRINRFALFLPAECSHLCRLLIPREGQVSSDAISDSVAHHVVAAALCADQLAPVKKEDLKKKESEIFTASHLKDM